MDLGNVCLPVVALEHIEEYYPPAEYEVILGVGYSRMNDIRQNLFNICKEKGYYVASYIHPTAVISKDAKLGEGNIILENTLLQPFVELGRGNLLLYNVSVAHNDKIGDFCTLTGGTSLAGFVTVENNCFLGNSSMVFDHVTLAKYTLLGANAYVKKNTKPYEVIVPARSLTLEGRVSTEFL